MWLAFRKHSVGRETAVAVTTGFSPWSFRFYLEVPCTNICETLAGVFVRSSSVH